MFYFLVILMKAIVSILEYTAVIVIFAIKP